jgi:cytochrome c553
MQQLLFDCAAPRNLSRSMLIRVAILLLLASLAGRVHGQTLEEKAAICGACHGEAGVPQEKTTPIIWGQPEGYLYIQLRDFKRGTRKDERMSPIAEALERGEMLTLAEYLSKKSWPGLGQPAAPPELARQALTANTSVGCTGCHLDHYQGDGTVPRLAGQSREYLVKTMADFRSRKRANNPGMSDLMAATSESDLAALAEYLAGL